MQSLFPLWEHSLTLSLYRLRLHYELEHQSVSGINVDAAVCWIHLDIMAYHAVSVPVDLLGIRPSTL